jgi:hypothetical protein
VNNKFVLQVSLSDAAAPCRQCKQQWLWATKEMKNNKEDAAQRELSYINLEDRRRTVMIVVSLAGHQNKVLWKPRKAKTKWIELLSGRAHK